MAGIVGLAPSGSLGSGYNLEAFKRGLDENPDFIRALMAPDAMTIPPRLEDGAIARAAQAGPVFSVHPDGHLHMRYTARTVSIEWRSDAATVAAVAALGRILAAETPWTLHGRLEPGMGLVCNNVLHDRAAFAESDTQKRLLYRARYYDRIVDAPYRAD